MISKIVGLEEAVADIPDGVVIGIGGFGYAGTPFKLVEALASRNPKPKNLTVTGTGLRNFMDLLMEDCVKKVITTYPSVAGFLRSLITESPIAKQTREGKVEVEICPQGNMIERWRAAGVGIPAFYTPIGVGTELAQGKELRNFQGQEYILETALKLDYALIKAHKADRLGNLVYHGTARNHNPIMAMAAKVTIVEVDEIVDVGEIDPEFVATPGIFVHRVVKVQKAGPYDFYYKYFPEEMKRMEKYLGKEAKGS